MPDHVHSPSLATCCGAAFGLAKGLIRPRRPDERFLRSLADAGLPATNVLVTVSVLRQNPRPVPTALVVEGRTKPRRIATALQSFIVTHPEVTFLVDPAFCLDAHRRVLTQLPGVLRVAVRPPPSTVATLTALQERPPRARTPDFALPTHAHWDHVCGLLDLPGLPVHLHRPERSWVMDSAAAPVGGVRDSLRDRPIVDYELDGPPVLTFTSSHDLLGDGSVLLLNLSGHTPGSVGILLHTRAGWVLLAGDAAWHTYQIDSIRQKSAYPGMLADQDRSQTFQTLHRLHAARHQVLIIPTHDFQAAQRLAGAPADPTTPAPSPPHLRSPADHAHLSRPHIPPCA